MAKKISIEEYEEKEEKKAKQKSKDEKQEEKVKEKNKLLLPLEIMIVLFGCSLIGIVLLLTYYKPDTSEYTDEIERLEKQLDSKDDTIESYKYDLNRLTGGKTVQYMEEKLDFFDNNVVFRIEGFGNYYYSYDCMLQKVNGSYTYWAYNKEKAAVEGLRPGGC